MELSDRSDRGAAVDSGLDPDRLGATNGSGQPERVVLTPIEHDVIQALGIELAQARVDIAYLAARLKRLKGATDPMVLATDVGGARAPDGYVFIRQKDVMTLQTLLA